MTEEQELSRRLRRLVDEPPAGRDLAAAVRRASAQRKARIAALGSGLGVTTVVVGGAALAGVFTGSSPSGAVGGAPVGASTVATPTIPTGAQPSAVVASAVASAKAVGPSVAPTTTGAAAPQFWYERTINEQFGIRTVRRAWVGSNESIRYQQPDPGRSTVTTVTEKWDETTAAGATLTWSDFVTAPTTVQLHAWMYETPAASVKHFGHDLTGTARADVYAFETAMQLLVETPATPAFRLAVIEAAKQVPGVTVADGVTDEIGRTGVQLSLHTAPDVGDGTSTDRDLVDPADGRLLQGELTDDSVCPAGSLVWRAVYLELGYVPDDKTALPETIAAPTGQPANCVTDGQNPPPGATVTSLPAAH